MLTNKINFQIFPITNLKRNSIFLVNDFFMESEVKLYNEYQ